MTHVRITTLIRFALITVLALLFAPNSAHAQDRVQPMALDFRWSSTLTDQSLIALLVWVLLMAALLIAGRPWSELALSNLSDRGAGFSRLIAWLLATFAVWLLVSVDFISFRSYWLALSLACVWLTGTILLRIRPQPEHSPSDPASITGSEIVFWVTFGIALVLRLFNPDSWHPLWGGEKPMEFAHMNAILRSDTFPPHDPWFSGEPINYYYFGEYMVASLFRLTGIPSEIGFNLAQPLVIALLASAVYSISSTLAGRLSSGRVHPRSGGAVATLLFMASGNLIASQNIVDALPDIPQPSFLDWTWAASRAITGGITEFPYFTGLYGDLHAHVIAWPITLLIVGLCLQWVLAARQNLTTTSEPEQTNNVRHKDEPSFELRPLNPATFLLTAIALGSLGAANAWDVPLYAVFVLAAAVTAVGVPFKLEGRSSWLQLPKNLAISAVIFALAYLLFLPFHRSFQALFTSVDQVRAGTKPSEFGLHLGGLLTLVLLGLLALGARRFAQRKPRHDLRYERILVVSTFLLAIVVSGLLVLFVDRQPAALWSVLLSMALSGAMSGVLCRAYLTQTDGSVLVPAVLLLPVATAALLGWTVLAIALAFGFSGFLLWIASTAPAERFVGILIAAGGFAAAGVELIFVVDDLESLEVWYRMNTVFKLYIQVWSMLAIVAGVVAALFLLGGWKHLSADSHDEDREAPEDSIANGSPSSPPGLLGWIGGLTSVLVLTLGLVYPLTSTIPRLDLRFPGHPAPTTLDAIDWMRYGTLTTAAGATIAFNEDRDVINWFNQEIDGAPVILEASIGPYRGNGSRISIATGLPTVIGWDRHERQQRAAPDISRRVADVSEIYNTMDPDRKLELLQRYSVTYIIVGDVERYTLNATNGQPYATAEGLAVFDEMVGEGLEIAFRSGDTVVYRVV